MNSTAKAFTHPRQPPIRVQRIRTVEEFDRIRPRLHDLVAPFSPLLLDEATGNDNRLLLKHLKSTVPYLWVGRDIRGELWTGASLNDVIPRRHAFIHGISRPEIRRHPAIVMTALAAIDFAFEELAVLKVKAEFDADNLGAKGFCLRFGFRGEAHFHNDLRVNGRPKDVLVYSLFAQTYYRDTRRKMHHVLWQESKQTPQDHP